MCSLEELTSSCWHSDFRLSAIELWKINFFCVSALWAESGWRTGVGDFGVGKTTEKGNAAPGRERERGSLAQWRNLV